jgi:uncharacterized protein (DUF934 family)
MRRLIVVTLFERDHNNAYSLITNDIKVLDDEKLQIPLQIWLSHKLNLALQEY